MGPCVAAQLLIAAMARVLRNAPCQYAAEPGTRGQGTPGAALPVLPLALLENVNPCRHRGLGESHSRHSTLALHKFQLFSVCELF